MPYSPTNAPNSPAARYFVVGCPKHSEAGRGSQHSPALSANAASSVPPYPFLSLPPARSAQQHEPPEPPSHRPAPFRTAPAARPAAHPGGCRQLSGRAGMGRGEQLPDVPARLQGRAESPQSAACPRGCRTPRDASPHPASSSRRALNGRRARSLGGAAGREGGAEAGGEEAEQGAGAGCPRPPPHAAGGREAAGRGVARAAALPADSSELRQRSLCT